MSFRIQKYLMELFFFFWIFFSISSLFSTFALFLWKKAEYMRASLLTRATRDGKNWRTWWASHTLSDRRDILAFNHLCVGRFKRTLQFVTVTLWKMNLGSQTHVNFPEKTEVVLKNFINSNKNLQTCLDVVKVNPPKKLSRDPRRLASNSRLAVSLGTLYVSFTFYIRWERDMDDAFWKRWWNATVPRIIDFEITNADLY